MFPEEDGWLVRMQGQERWGSRQQRVEVGWMLRGCRLGLSRTRNAMARDLPCPVFQLG